MVCDLRELGSNEVIIFFSNLKWKTTVVPVHWNEDISAWLLKKILRDIWLDVATFDDLR